MKYTQSIFQLKDEVDLFITQKGSVYKKTDDFYQRFKTNASENEKKLKKPMDLTVFIPPFEEFIKKINPHNKNLNQVPVERLEEVIGTEYKSFLSEHTYYDSMYDLMYNTDETTSNYVANIKKEIILDNKTAKNQSNLFLIYSTKKENLGIIPVITEPKLDYTPYEIRLENKNKYIRHLGHKVIGIVYKNGKIIEK